MSAVCLSFKQKFQEYLSLASGAYSPATIRALRSDMESFCHWCISSKESPFPASPHAVRAYLLELAARRTASTIRRHLASIAHAHRAVSLADPTKTQVVRLTMRTIARQLGTRKKQVDAIDAEAADRAFGQVDWSDLRNVRDIAMLLVARDLLLRRSELVALTIEDVSENADGSGTALIRSSKSDPLREGAVGWLSDRTMTVLKQWLGAVGTGDGTLFRSVDRLHRLGDRLSDKQVARRFKRLAERVGLVASRISGQSCRVGMAQDLVSAGAELPAVMQAGRWKSPAMPARYAERLLAARGAVAQYHKKLKP